jgi:hypothetical protein
MTDTETKLENILNMMAEVYCQLGESGKRRTRLMVAGRAYKTQIMALIHQDRLSFLKSIRSGLDELDIIFTAKPGDMRTEHISKEEVVNMLDKKINERR